MSFVWWPRSTSDPPPPPPAPPLSAADRRGARDRRERIATAILARIASRPEATGCAQYSVTDADVRYSVQVADMLIQEIDKEGGR